MIHVAVCEIAERADAAAFLGRNDSAGAHVVHDEDWDGVTAVVDIAAALEL